MTNKKRQQAAEQSDGFDLDKIAETHARKRYWDVKSVGTMQIEMDVACGIADFKAGFNKALNLVMERFDQLALQSDKPRDWLYEAFLDLKAIISKLRGEK